MHNEVGTCAEILPKHANGVFHKEIEHSHFSQRGNDRVLKFQGKLLFSDFVVE